MLTVPILLDSAITGQRKSLGLMIIDNVGGSKTKGDYRVRMYRAGSDHTTAAYVIRTKTPIREGKITGHARLTEPVGSLVAKALNELGY